MTDADQRLQMIERAVAGDLAALTLLLTESRPRLCSYLSRKIPSDLKGLIDADDLAQETHVVVFRRIGSFENRGADSFDRWVTTIGAHALRDAVKMRRTLRRGAGHIGAQALPRSFEDSVVALLDQLAVSGRTPSRSAIRHEAVAAVQNAISDLPEDYRRAVWLVYIEGRSVEAAAVEMGRSKRAIHNLCHKAKGRLREILGSDSRFRDSWQ